MVSANPRFFAFLPQHLLLIMAPVGLKGGIRRLPRYLHGYPQSQCHGSEPIELPECDLPVYRVEC
jgi:hypothetical protein